MSAALRLEDFARPAAPPLPGFSAADLATEYRRGRAEGEAAGRDADMAALTEGLRHAARAAEIQDGARRQTIAEVLDAVSPVILAITRQLSADTEGRLTRVITAELARLCLAGITPTCRIAGDAGLIRRLSARIDDLGLSHVTLLPGTCTEITFDGGRIALDPTAITDQIAALLAELSPSEE